MAQKNGLSISQIIFTIISALIIVVVFGNLWLDWGLLGLQPTTFTVIGIFVACLLLWLFVAIDWPSILCLILLGLLPEMTYGQVFQLSFGNTTFVFLFFTFIVTYALQETPFLKRITARALHNEWAQRSPAQFILAFLSAMLFLASFISPTILFMIAFPLYEEIVQQFGLDKGDRNASLLLIALYSTLAIGTAMTPINHVFAITAMGIYEASVGQAITNAEYMSFGVPGGLVIFLGMLASLKWLWRMDFTGVEVKRVDSLKTLPPVTKQERWTVAIFALVVAMWLVPELVGGFFPSFQDFFKTAGIAFPPMVGALLLAVTRVESKPLVALQEAIAKGVYWPSLLIVAGTLSLGSVLANPAYGVTTLIESGITPFLNQLSPIILVLLFITWAGIQTNFSSNLVTTTVVTTILMTLINNNADLNINAAVLASLIGFMASLAYMTPPAMPYVAISIGSGWTSAKEALTRGGWILIISIIAATFVAYPLGTLFLSHLQ